MAYRSSPPPKKDTGRKDKGEKKKLGVMRLDHSSGSTDGPQLPDLGGLLNSFGNDNNNTGFGGFGGGDTGGGGASGEW